MANATDVRPSRDIAPVWQSTEGKLIVRKCNTCGDAYYYPRDFCPLCASDDVTWVECSGDATVYSHSTMRRGDPYTIAMVTLAEGPRMMTNIVDCNIDTLSIDDAVRVVFKDVDGVSTPMFTTKR